MKLLFLMIAFSIAGLGQTVESRSVMLKGTSLPGTCTVGERYFKTDATAGQNLYLCTSTNTWTQVSGGSGASYPTDLGCKLTVSTTTATFASGASGTNPCNFNNGPITSPVTLVVSGSPTAGTYYWETDGSTVRVKAPGTSGGLTPSGLTIVESASSFSFGGWVPIGTTAYTSGTDWDTTAVDSRPHFSLTMNPVCGTGLTSSNSGINRTCNVDTTYTMALATAQTSTAKKTFTPTASDAGAQMTCAALPSSPANGDIACDSGDSNKVKVRSNGAWVEVGGGSSPSYSTSHSWTQFGIQPMIHDSYYLVSTGNPIVRHYDETATKVFNRISVFIGTALGSSAVLRIGIYNAGCGTQIAESDAFTSTSGTSTNHVTFPSAVTLTPGTYCVMVGSNGAVTLSVSTLSSTTLFVNSINQGTVKMGTCANGMTGSGTTATLPSSCGTITGLAKYFNLLGTN